MLRRILKATLLVSLLPVTCAAGDDLLKKVPQLQETAARASGGAMGCGVGGYILLHTSRGLVIAWSGIDTIPVFGENIYVADLLSLLKARAEHLRTGAANPMSGRVSELVYVTLDTLSRAQDPETVPVIAELLNDGDEAIRGWAAIALYRLGEFKELRPKVRKVRFPPAAVQSARSRSNEPPAWVRLAPDAEPRRAPGRRRAAPRGRRT